MGQYYSSTTLFGAYKSFYKCRGETGLLCPVGHAREKSDSHWLPSLWPASQSNACSPLRRMHPIPSVLSNSILVVVSSSCCYPRSKLAVVQQRVPSPAFRLFFPICILHPHGLWTLLLCVLVGLWFLLFVRLFLLVCECCGHRLGVH